MDELCSQHRVIYHHISAKLSVNSSNLKADEARTLSPTALTTVFHTPTTCGFVVTGSPALWFTGEPKSAQCISNGLRHRYSSSLRPGSSEGLASERILSFIGGVLM